MKRKRILSLLILPLVLILFLSGCGEGGNSDIEVKNNNDDIYYALDGLIDNPSGQIPEAVSNEFTFTAMIVSDPYDMSFDEETEEYIYQNAVIARNAEGGFMLDVSDVESAEPGDVVSITAVVKGLIYNTIDNERVEVLDLTAKKMEKRDPNFDLESSNVKEIKTKDKDVTIEFEKAFMEDQSGVTNDPADANYSIGLKNEDTLIVYIKYTNNGDSDAKPIASDYGYMYLGGTRMKNTTIHSNLEVEENRLLADSFVETTFPGKTQEYYLEIAPDVTGEGGVQEGVSLEFENYDDDFNLIHYLSLPVEVLKAGDLAE